MSRFRASAPLTTQWKHFAFVAEGPVAACEALLELLVTGHTPGRTDRVEHAVGPAVGGLVGFVRR